MKKLILKKDVVTRLSSESQIHGGYNSGPGSCQKGICITPRLTTILDKKPEGDPVDLSGGKITCRDSGPNTNATMASCHYGC